MTTYSDFFSKLNQDRASQLTGEFADVLLARGLMAVLYREAALMVMAAHEHGIGMALREWTNEDRLEIKGGLQQVWITRRQRDIEAEFFDFPKEIVPERRVKIAPGPSETPEACAQRTMGAIQRAFWPASR